MSPGYFRTDLVDEAIKAGQVTEEFVKASEARQGRSATFEEVGDVVVLLSTPRMSLVNGVNLPIDGGFVINEGPA